jgi:uncharacterized protein YkwD
MRIELRAKTKAVIGSPVSPGRRSCLQLRLAAPLAVLAVAVSLPLLAPGLAVGGTRPHSVQSALDLSVVDQINELRVSFGLRPLTFSQGLFGAARVHCEQMVDGGYFGHQAPDGPSFDARLYAYYPQQHRVTYAVGENLLWSEGPMSGAAMVAEWMQSAPHRANLLNPRWRQVAVASLSVSWAPGAYSGLAVTVVTADFGVR